MLWEPESSQHQLRQSSKRRWLLHLLQSVIWHHGGNSSRRIQRRKRRKVICPRFPSRTISMGSSRLEVRSVRLATERLCRAISSSLITTPSWHHLHCYGFLESQNIYYIRTYASPLEAATSLCSDVIRFGKCLFLKIGLATQGVDDHVRKSCNLNA